MEPRVFFFHNFGAYGGIRTAFKVFTLLAAIFTPFVLIRWLKSFLRRFSDRRIPRKERWKVNLPSWLTLKYYQAVLQQRGQQHVVPTHQEQERELSDMGWVLSIYHWTVGLIGLGFSIAAIELELRWNNLEGINGVITTGQIIPLAVGSISLLRAFVFIFESWTA